LRSEDVSSAAFEHVGGKTFMDSLSDEMSPFMIELCGERPKPKRTEPYPSCTSEPPEPAGWENIFHRIDAIYHQQKTWWRCGEYSKVQIDDHVWIRREPRFVGRIGHGNAALRRQGWTATVFCRCCDSEIPPAKRQVAIKRDKASEEDGIVIVWRDRDGNLGPTHTP
jgi:hypothetical protein